jgi:hypothetical protein
MIAQSLFQCRTVTLHPTPDRRVSCLLTTLSEQFFNVAQRERVPEIPTHGTQNQLRRRLPPLEDCRSGCMLHGLFRLPVTPAEVATHPQEIEMRRSKPGKGPITLTHSQVHLPAGSTPEGYEKPAYALR